MKQGDDIAKQRPPGRKENVDAVSEREIEGDPVKGGPIVSKGRDKQEG